MVTEPIVHALERGPDLVVPLVRSADPSILKRRPPSGKWSVHEHACHLAEVDALMTRRLDLMLSEEHPRIRSFDPGRDDPDGHLLSLNLDESLRTGPRPAYERVAARRFDAELAETAEDSVR